MYRLKGKVALITGGSSGIGLGTARLFAAERAFVIVTGGRQAELTAAVSLLGGTAIGIQGDSSRSADLDQLFDRIREKHGRIDVLFRKRRSRRVPHTGGDHGAAFRCDLRGQSRRGT